MTPLVIICAELVCALGMGILLYGTLFENRQRDKKTQWFVVCVALNIAALLLDAFSWSTDGKPELDWLDSITSLLSIIMLMPIVASFGYYMHALICEKKKISRRFADINAIVCGADMLLAVVGSFTGLTYTITDEHTFETGIMYTVCNAIVVLCTLYLLFIGLRHREVLGKHDSVALTIYHVFPLAVFAAEVFYPEYSFMYIAIALTFVLLYVMLQSGHVSEMKMREQLLQEMSFRDSLTGLKNRRAFNDDMDRLDKDKSVGIIFSDLNGLKYANDHLGHKEGDNLIAAYGNVLRQLFAEQNIYRISGDEFVVMLQDIQESFLNDRFRMLKHEMSVREDMAAVGSSYGYGSEIRQVSDDAETKMYADKARSHLKHPEWNRE